MYVQIYSMGCDPAFDPFLKYLWRLNKLRMSKHKIERKILVPWTVANSPKNRQLSEVAVVSPMGFTNIERKQSVWSGLDCKQGNVKSLIMMSRNLIYK